ncbi:MAG: diol dehydratase small subunit [bacterium]|jgi:propanediol dehydratase small subunit
MVDKNALEQIVREVLKSLQEPGPNTGEVPCTNNGQGLDPARDYPLATKRPDLVRTPTGKGLDEITLDKVLKGEITPQDVRITAETLRLQAEIADKVGRPQFARNLRRAAELTRVPDERILAIYRALRPHRSTKEELLAIAEELESKYNAKANAALVREAAAVYERRGLLRTA